MITAGKIHKISVSATKGSKKKNIESAMIIANHGIDGDAHAGSGRQVSLLPLESFAKVKSDLLTIDPGDFAENITTIGLDFTNAKIGQLLRIGENIRLEITQIGKTCHQGCYIRTIVGDCIMPREGIFAKVIAGGSVLVSDPIGWE